MERMTNGVRLVCVNALDVLAVAVAAGEDLLAEAVERSRLADYWNVPISRQGRRA